LSQNSSTEIKKFYQMLSHYIKNIDSKGLSIRITGQSLKDALVLDTLVRSQVYGLALATLIISFVLYVIFRSVAMAALSLVSIIFPILTNTGLMGAFGLPVGSATAFVAAISLCITVRFAVHFLSEYQKRWTQGLLTSKAIKYSLLAKGPAIVMSSFVLAIGFSAMAISQWGELIHFGILCAFSIVAIMVANLVFMPAVILLNKDKLDSDDPMV
jgi:predicted RND superfamily exporter protein